MSDRPISIDKLNTYIFYFGLDLIEIIFATKSTLKSRANFNALNQFRCFSARMNRNIHFSLAIVESTNWDCEMCPVWHTAAAQLAV